MNWHRPDARACVSPLLTLLVLAGLAWSAELREPTADALAVQQRIRQQADAIPKLIKGWYGQDVPVPAPAIRILRPNVLLSRRYRHIQTGDSVSLLLVHTRDAVDLIHHYPPVCYRYNGWESVWNEQRRWRVDGLDVPVTEYCFQRGDLDGRRRIVVTNFMFGPDGLSAEMEPVRRIANDPAKRFFGAGQVQLVFDVSVPLERRKEVFAGFVGACRGAIDTLVERAAK